MELRHLRYFVTVAEEGHVTRAAERLGMQQPPLSQQIKAMERELAVQLFRRKPRGVELTDAGRVFFDDVRSILARLDHAVETTRRTARGEEGRISVGISNTGAYHPLVPQVIRAFREANPRVFVMLEEGRNRELIDSLQSERLDAAIVRTIPDNSEALVINRLHEEPMVVALPSGLPLAQRNRGATIALKDLANETFIAPPSQHATGMRGTVLAAFRKAGFKPRIGQEAPRTSSALSFVAAGFGVSFVPASLERMRLDGVVYRRLDETVRLTAPLNLVTRRGDPSVVVRHFMTLVKKAAQNFTDD